jgi:hypothetical protein
MTETAIATKIHEPLDIHGYFTPQITFDCKFGHIIPQLIHLSICDILDLGRCINARRRANLARPGATYAVNRGQRDFCMLMIWDIYSSDTGHTVFLINFEL